MSGRYEDLYARARPVSLRHPPMPEMNRAAQFAPFAALSGFDDEIREAGRWTDEWRGLGEADIMLLEAKLRILQEREKERPEVSVTSFQPDARKSGGAFVTRTGRVKRVDDCLRVIVFADRTEVPLDAVVDLEGKVFGTIADEMDAQ